jgi:4-alpha-glucanotransferase
MRSMDKARRPPSSPGIDPWGVASRYKDNHGKWRAISDPTRGALYAGMRAAEGEEIGAGPIGPLFVLQGATVPIPKNSALRLEDGTQLEGLDQLSLDLPLGYHELLDSRTGATRRLIVAPAECHWPDNLPMWGWTVQLYSVRSADSWGIGDLADLRQIAHWSADLGASILCVNPLAADTPVLPQQASPYSPSSRCFRNPLYLAVGDVPSATALPGFDEAMAAGRALNRGEHIDRDTVLRLKLQVLRAAWERFSADTAFDTYVAQQGALLENFSRFCALAERHGRDWRVWPAEYRRPESPAVEHFAKANASAVRFHAWVQWQLDIQLGRAAAELPLMQDLPIGVDAGGADAWAWQDYLAGSVSVGAPPDMFNQLGQNWGLPPFVPHRLRAANYEPFIQTLRAALRGAGGLRIDHVMGLFRLFWIPDGMPASAGGYVHYPTEDLLAIVALESHRARSLIVGEDLGTVQPAIRRRLAAARILSYRLIWFEQKPPRTFPKQSFAAVTTHDLPTVAGLWSGQDEQHEIAAGLPPNTAGWNAIRARLQEHTQLSRQQPLEEVIRHTYRLLGSARSVLRTAALEDAAAAPYRPNMPGVVAGWPSWSRPLPVGLEELERLPLTLQIAAELNASVKGDSTKRRRAKKPST